MEGILGWYTDSLCSQHPRDRTGAGRSLADAPQPRLRRFDAPTSGGAWRNGSHLAHALRARIRPAGLKSLADECQGVTGVMQVLNPTYTWNARLDAMANGSLRLYIQSFDSVALRSPEFTASSQNLPVKHPLNSPFLSLFFQK